MKSRRKVEPASDEVKKEEAFVRVLVELYAKDLHHIALSRLAYEALYGKLDYERKG